jgi:hypothetical protein
MNFTCCNEDYAENIAKYIKEQKKYPFNVSVEPIKQLKTKKQLGYIFGGLISALQVYFFDLQGNVYDSNCMKDWLYCKCGIRKPVMYPDGITRDEPITLSQMTVEETSEFINNILNFIDNDTDCILTPELRYCWLLHVSQKDLDFAGCYNFLERDESYLKHQGTLTCINCGISGTEAHHVKLTKYASQNKPPDWLTIPLCHQCHIGKVHQKGQSEVIKCINTYKYDIEIFCKLAYLRWLYKK